MGWFPPKSQFKLDLDHAAFGNKSSNGNSKTSFQMQTKARSLSAKGIDIQKQLRRRLIMFEVTPGSYKSKLQLVKLKFSKCVFLFETGIVINKQARTPQVMRSWFARLEAGIVTDKQIRAPQVMHGLSAEQGWQVYQASLHGNKQERRK